MNTTKDAYCRLCAELKPHNKLTNLQDDKELCQKIVNKLSRFNIVMDFNENILPKTVCFVCTKALERAFTFITAVEQAQASLSDFILVQIKRDESDSDDENIFLDPPNESKDVVTIKGEDIDDEAIDVNNDYANVNPDENDQTVEIKHIVYECNDKVISLNDAKNSIVKNYEITVDIVKEPPDNNVNDGQNNNLNENKEDEIDRKDHIFVKASTKGKSVKRKSVKDSNMLPKSESDASEYSTDYINKQIKRLAAIPLNEIKVTWKDMSWKCSYCGTQFPSLIDLRSHLMECHNTCNSFQCIDCNGKKFRLNGFLKHVHHHRKYLHYSCYICYEKFENPNKARQHKLTHINSKFVCQGCNTSFPNNTELSNHVTTYYKNYLKPKIPRGSGSQGYACNVCNKVYISKTGRYYHMLTHTDRKRDHICEICGKGFFLKNNLSDHMINHTDARPYQCVICKYSFKTLSKLRYHAHVHSGVKPFACDQCGKCFREKRQLANHLTIHTDTLDFTCTFCSKKFRSNAFLQRHTLQHTGIKPYNCDICPRDFTNWANYNKHMKRKHGIDKARRKRTPQGPHAVDPTTGDVIYPEREKVLEWKKKMKEPMVPRNGGRPKIVKRIGAVDYQEGFTSGNIMESGESNSLSDPIKSDQIK